MNILAFLNKRLVPRILKLAIGLLYVFLHEVEENYNKPIITNHNRDTLRAFQFDWTV